MYLIQTVQTSWRPQLPLPKEVEVADENKNEPFKYTPHSSASQSNLVNNNHNNDMERLHQRRISSSAHKKDNSPQAATSSQVSNAASSKKWSFGRFFRKKKEATTDSSSEEDRKAGFVPAQKYERGNKSKSKKSSRSSKLNGAGFDHIVVNPPIVNSGASVEHELFLPVETVSPTAAPYEPYYQNQHSQSQHLLAQPGSAQQQLYSRSSNSLDRRAARAAHKSRSAQRPPHAPDGVPHTSSEEEIISLNSSTYSKYRSDESIHSGGQALFNGQSRRSRAARNERYYKRLSRDGEVSHGQAPQLPQAPPSTTQRWKTQPVPLFIYNGPPVPVAQTHVRQPPQQLQQMRNTSSLQHVAPTYVQWGQMQQQQQQQQQQLQQQQQQTRQLQNTMQPNKRSISYDSQIHLQNASGRTHSAKQLAPPPPPPRDPLRRVNVLPGRGGSSASDLRPISYAFDKHGLPAQPPSQHFTHPAAPTAAAARGNGLSARCVSDDKIWAAPMPHYQSAHSLNMPNHRQQQQQHQPNIPQQIQPVAHSRRFITRAERDAQPSKQSLPNGIDLHYVADATPRSRKPIHLLEQQQQQMSTPDTGATDDGAAPCSTGILRTTKSGLPTKKSASDFWKRIDESSAQQRGRAASRGSLESFTGTSNKPRSISSSRLSELRSYPMPMYSEVFKPKRTALQPQGEDHLSNKSNNNVVCGSLNIKAAPTTPTDIPNNNSNYVEIRRKPVEAGNKSNSMPHHYQRRSAEIPSTPNKYDEYVAEKRQLHQKPIFTAATPPAQRKFSIPPPTTVVPMLPLTLSYPRKKPANLEEAINELEAIYKSLGLTEPPTQPHERIPTPGEFEQFALAHADDYDDEDSPTGEPDPVRDDVARRQLQLANLQHKTVDKQPPFGIPIGPIVPAPQSDYLHVATPQEAAAKSQLYSTTPDVISDDLAVRTLRKDAPGMREKFVYPLSGSLQKKQRATRTQSANIYALIQRDAAKPSGGDMSSYMELTRSIERAGSANELNKSDSATDIPATLTLLRNLKQQEEQQSAAKKAAQIPFRHPSQGGAICQLPEKLSSPGREEQPGKMPVPLPRKSLTPEPLLPPNQQVEEALEQIAKEAQESSVKLSQELHQLRQGALITAARPKPTNVEEQQLAEDLQQIEAVSAAAKRCGKMLLEALPDATEADETAPSKQQRKLHKEGKLIAAIDQVSEAANAVCEKILKDIVTTEPPVIVQQALQVKNNNQKTEPKEPPLVMPNLIKKLDPMQSEQIEVIAKRCMRQLSELGTEQPDYDNLCEEQTQTQTLTSAAVACNSNNANEVGVAQTVDTIISTLAETQPQAPQHKELEEIDKIMLECETKAKQLTEKPPSGSSGSSAHAHVPTSSNTTASSSCFSSSSDCLAKSSSSPYSAGGRRLSSSITSFNPYSSSDYIKSPSSEYHAPSTDPIKTFSTTSYDKSTSSLTPNNTNTTTNSTFSYSPSPPLNLTPKSVRARSAAAGAAGAAVDGERLSAERGRSSSPSQYNSSEELAMIFGIEEKPKQSKKAHENPLISGNNGASIPHHASCVEASSITPSNNHALCCATPTATALTSKSASEMQMQMQMQETNTNAACQPTNTNVTSLLNVVDIVNDVVDAPKTNIAHTTNPRATSTPPPTNASPISCKLETIPELLSGEVEESLPHSTLLSPNFNRLYASKISILVDRAPGEHGNVAPLTQFDSLSSLEETSSNPDSGNVSLADFPLGTSNSNACLQLHTAYNSRFEVRNTFVSEVSIPHAPKVEEKLNETDFPPLPTEVELLNSLKENDEMSDNTAELEEVRSLVELDETRAEDKYETSETVDTISSITEDYSSLQEQLLQQDICEPDENCIDVVAVNEKSNFNDMRESSIEKEAPQVELPVEGLDESLPQISENLEVEEILPEITRKSSVIYETPQLNMSISEVKVNYEFEETFAGKTDNDLMDVVDTAEAPIDELAQQQNVLQRIKQCTAEVEKLNEALDQMPRRRNTRHNEAGPTTTTTAEVAEAEVMQNPRQLSLLPWHCGASSASASTVAADARSSDDNKAGSANDANSTTALSLLGELRPANSLTALEHVLVACSLGVISPNDLFTLCLIIIGVITLIAMILL